MKRSDFLRRSALAGVTFSSGAGLTSCDRNRDSAAPVATTADPAQMAFPDTSVTSMHQKLAQGKATAESLARESLKRIEALDRQGSKLRAVIETNPDAIEIAKDVDRNLLAGRWKGPLHGLPVLVKDNIDTADRMCTTAGSLALEGSIAPRDSFVVGRLREAGLVLLGKTNLSEWANFRGNRSISGWSGRGGQTLNPHCLDRNPSGSSSGSAAAVAAGYVPFAIGTETNGSIVSPASCCGIVGIKPTVGLVSRSGIIPISSSQDTAGTMARTVSDAAALLAMIIGTDSLDSATERQADKADRHPESLLNPRPMSNPILGVARKLFSMHPLVDEVFQKALTILRESGAQLQDIELPSPAELNRADLVVMSFEYKQGLNDYFASLGDGARIKSIDDLIAVNEKEAKRELILFGQERLIEAAALGPLTHPGYLAAKARCVEWSKSIEDLIDANQLDAVIAPTAGPAATIDIIHGERGLGGCSTYAAVAGLPHITVPCGDVFGLPVGLSFFGRAWSEPTLVNIALAFEQAAKALRTPKFLPMLQAPA